MAGLSTSWTRRLFERTGISTVWAGVALLAIVFTAFLIQELALGRLESVDINRLGAIFLVFTHIAIVAYGLTACAYCEQARDASIAGLRPLLDLERAAPALDTKERDRATHLAVGLLGVGVSILITLYVTPGPASYDPATWSAESGWHRALSPLMGFWTARLASLILVESRRLSALAASLHEIDLLDLDRLAPFARRGLSHALVVIGAVSVFALFLADRGYLGMVAGLLVVSLAVGGIALLLPLRGVRDRVRAAKREELAWCREKLCTARADLASGNARPGELQELVAWESRIEAINEWPVDASTYTRFGLYLLIPLGSWAGGALVERLIDSLLD
jgi:hypothetical protein